MGKDVLLVAVLELHRHRQTNEWFLLEATMAIAKLHVIGMDFTDVTACIKHGHTGNNILHFTVISTGIHIRCTADAPGNTAGKFKTAQTKLGTSLTHIDEGKTCAGTDSIVLNKEGAQALGGNDHTAHALVGNKDIATLSKHKIIQAFTLANAHHSCEFIHTMWKNHCITRATNAEGSVGAKGFVEFHVVFADNVRKEIFHGDVSFRFRDSVFLRLRRCRARGNLPLLLASVPSST